MLQMVRGQRARLQDLLTGTRLLIGVRVAGPAREYDVTVFGLDEHSRIQDDRYTVFYNQKRSPEGAIEQLGPANGDAQRFLVDLARLPGAVRRLSVAATTDEGTFGQVSSGHLRLMTPDGQEVARYEFHGADFSTERAVTLGEVYFKDVWRVAATGQGFSGGLRALVESLGGEVKDAPPTPPVSAPVSPPSPPPTAPAAPAPPASSVNLTKVTLDKQGERASINLRKSGTPQPIHVNLNWDQQATRSGLFGMRTSRSADLDLGCMYVLKDGNGGVVQALGNHFGSERLPPYIVLDKDDRSGSSADGENLYIVRPDLIQQVLLFAFIYDGTNDFTDVNGRLQLKDASGNEVAVRLNNPDVRRTFCAIAMLENVGGRIEITKEERYFHGHAEADAHYGFGFRWAPGSK
ncbi:TerD family protein [Deinococcus maricopensis]|uniref:Tellurium resistance n=1 Tax=Deinococcus maricopensis (strain DSM 21211 / LMG 22137 / NRRL B-23946 / LB-34) TaxID=709986 RepID=E8U3R0_DEIML|nr:TerD family protein [Deinococcus maricopensis]ADV68753.1 Tellurium resistance [Deinococcus maricopensis DSM 21211]